VTTVFMNPAATFTANSFQGWGFQNATENLVRIVMTRTAILRRLFVTLNTAPSVGDTRTFTVRVNGANTALTVSLTGAATTASDVATLIPVVANDLVTVQHTIAGAPTASGGSISYEIAA
jgi:hypothetical protein